MAVQPTNSFLSGGSRGISLSAFPSPTSFFPSPTGALPPLPIVPNTAKTSPVSHVHVQISEASINQYHPRAMDLLKDVTEFASRTPAHIKAFKGGRLISIKSRQLLKEAHTQPPPPLPAEKRAKFEALKAKIDHGLEQMTALSDKSTRFLGLVLHDLPDRSPHCAIADGLAHLKKMSATLTKFLSQPDATSQPVGLGLAGPTPGGTIRVPIKKHITAAVAQGANPKSPAAASSPTRSPKEKAAGATAAETAPLSVPVSPAAASLFKNLSRGLIKSPKSSVPSPRSAQGGLIPVLVTDVSTVHVAPAVTRSGGKRHKGPPPTSTTAPDEGPGPDRDARTRISPKSPVPKPVADAPSAPAPVPSPTQQRAMMTVLDADNETYWSARYQEIAKVSDESRCATNFLTDWMLQHFERPYPDGDCKEMLARITGLTRKQVSDWFINARGRKWKRIIQTMAAPDADDKDGGMRARKLTARLSTTLIAMAQGAKRKSDKKGPDREPGGGPGPEKEGDTALTRRAGKQGRGKPARTIKDSESESDGKGAGGAVEDGPGTDDEEAQPIARRKERRRTAREIRYVDSPPLSELEDSDYYEDLGEMSEGDEYEASEDEEMD